MESKQQSGQKTPSRREFMKAAGAAATTAAVVNVVPSTVFGANDRLGVGLIGAGGRNSSHAGQLMQIKERKKDIEIVAICDTYRPRAQRLADKVKAPNVYMDHRELLQNEDVDVVGIATPDHIHGPQTIDAAKAGKHIYCEKPFTHWRQFELTMEAVEVVKQSGCKFQLGSQGLSDGAWTQMRDLVQAGQIGQPIYAECGYFRVGDWGERGMPIDDPNVQPGPDLDWEAFLGDAPKRDFDVSRYFRWRMYEDYSGGPVTDLFPHSLTPVAYILGLGMPDRVVGTGGIFRYNLETVPDDPRGVEREVPDTFNMLADYDESLTVAVLGTQGNNYQATGFRGAGGRIPVVSGWEGTLTVVGNEIVYAPAQESKSKPAKWDIKNGEDVRMHWMDLFNCIREGGTPRSDIEMAGHVQATLQMAALALRNKTMARYDAENNKIVL
jgi:predicted dehydrogenase